MTTPDAPIAPPGEGDVLAAELALGLLEGEERALALRRQLSDPSFAQEVDRWRAHFATLFGAVPEHAAPDQLIERIERTLVGGEPAAPAVALPVRLAPSPGFWRPLALASSLAAAGLAGVLLLFPASRAPTGPMVAGSRAQPMMIAALAHDGGAPFAAYYDSAGGMVKMPGPMPIPANRSAQLWAIEPGKAPQPLGLFHVAGTMVVAEVKTQRAIPAGTTLAISLEPVGGSPTGLPTGPVVASGALGRV